MPKLGQGAAARFHIIFFALFVSTALLPTRAQTNSSTKTEINGSERPDLVPDRDAYMVLFLTMSDRSPVPRSDRFARLQNAGLGSVEAGLVVNAANEFRSSYDSIMLRTKQIKDKNPSRPLPPSVFAQFDALFAEGWAGLEKTRALLERDLGQAGSGRLKDFINTKIKPDMVVVPGR